MTIEETTEAEQRIKDKFDNQEKEFSEVEARLIMMRAFFKQFRDVLAPFSWVAYGFDEEIKFRYCDGNEDAKAIAKAAVTASKYLCPVCKQPLRIEQTASLRFNLYCAYGRCTGPGNLAASIGSEWGPSVETEEAAYKSLVTRIEKEQEAL